MKVIGFLEPPAAIEELQGSVGAVGDGYYLSLWVPAPHHKQKLPGPLSDLLMPLALLSCVALGRASTDRNGKAHTREAHGTSVTTPHTPISEHSF